MTGTMTRPPAECPRLYDYFTENDLAPTSSSEALVALAMRGIMTRGAPDPDGRIISSGNVGFNQRDALVLLERGNEDGGKRERRSKAQEHREVRAKLATLSDHHRTVLFLAYGPQDRVPGLKLGDNAQLRKRLDEASAELEIQNRSRARAHEKRFGNWRQVLIMSESAHATFNAWRDEWSAKLLVATTREKRALAQSQLHATFVHWLVNHAKPSTIADAQRDVAVLVREAWNAWLDASAGRSVRHLRSTSTFQREE